MSNTTVNWIRNHKVSSIILAIIRILIGTIFFMASLPKIGNPVWTGDHAGLGLSKFVQNALSLSQGPHAEVSGWYAWFLKTVVLPHATFFSYLVPWGELLTGIALIVGCFSSFSALMGIIMNLSYLLAGISSSNPLMLVGGMLVLFGGYNAGRIGVDYWVSPWCRTLWQNKTFLRFSIKSNVEK